MDFGKLIASLLETHDCVIVPSLGGFLAQRKSAILNNDGSFIPPQRIYSFNARLTGNDGVLLHAAVSTYGLSYDEASNQLNKFVSVARALLAAREKVFVDGVGELSVDEEGNVQFQPSNTQTAFNGSFGLRIIRAKPFEKEKETAVNKVIAPRPKSNQRTLSFRRAKQLKFMRSFVRYAALALVFLLVGGVGTIFYFIENQNESTTNHASLTPVIDTFKGTQAELKQEVIANEVRGSDTANVPTDEVMPLHSEVEISVEQSPAGYYVVIGAFVKEANADALYARLLEDLGTETPLLKTERNGLKVVGFFADKNYKRAVQVLRNAQQLEEKAWLLRI